MPNAKDDNQVVTRANEIVSHSVENSTEVIIPLTDTFSKPI